jgi:hypothetical protein
MRNFSFFPQNLDAFQNMCKNKKSLRKNGRKNQAVRIQSFILHSQKLVKILKAKKFVFVNAYSIF